MKSSRRRDYDYTAVEIPPKKSMDFPTTSAAEKSSSRTLIIKDRLPFWKDWHFFVALAFLLIGTLIVVALFLLPRDNGHLSNDALELLRSRYETVPAPPQSMEGAYPIGRTSAAAYFRGNGPQDDGYEQQTLPFSGDPSSADERFGKATFPLENRWPGLLIANLSIGTPAQYPQIAVFLDSSTFILASAAPGSEKGNFSTAYLPSKSSTFEANMNAMRSNHYQGWIANEELNLENSKSIPVNFQFSHAPITQMSQAAASQQRTSQVFWPISWTGEIGLGFADFPLKLAKQLERPLISIWSGKQTNPILGNSVEGSLTLGDFDKNCEQNATWMLYNGYKLPLWSAEVGENNTIPLYTKNSFYTYPWGYYNLAWAEMNGFMKNGYNNYDPFSYVKYELLIALAEAIGARPSNKIIDEKEKQPVSRGKFKWEGKEEVKKNYSILSYTVSDWKQTVFEFQCNADNLPKVKFNLGNNGELGQIMMAPEDYKIPKADDPAICILPFKFANFMQDGQSLSQSGQSFGSYFLNNKCLVLDYERKLFGFSMAAAQ